MIGRDIWAGIFNLFCHGINHCLDCFLQVSQYIWTFVHQTESWFAHNRLKTEVDAVVSDKEYIPYEDLSKLEYTLAVSTRLPCHVVLQN